MHKNSFAVKYHSKDCIAKVFFALISPTEFYVHGSLLLQETDLLCEMFENLYFLSIYKLIMRETKAANLSS